MCVKYPCGVATWCDVSGLCHRHGLWGTCWAGEVATLTTNTLVHRKPGVVGCPAPVPRASQHVLALELAKRVNGFMAS